MDKIDITKLRTIINFIQKQKIDSIHFLKKKYEVLIDFTEDGIVYRRGTVANIPINIAIKRKNYVKEQKEQSMYNQNIFYLKKYIEFRGNIEEFNSIVFSRDFTSIRIEKGYLT